MDTKKIKKNPEPDDGDKPPLPPPESALLLHDDIMDILEELLDSPISSPLDKTFRQKFDEVLMLFDLYQMETIVANNVTMTCRAGCSVCCNHWAEDIGSFELRILADYIKKNMTPKRIAEITDACRSDAEMIEKLEIIVRAKIEEFTARGVKDGLDQTFMTLSAFYQLDRPCPLLDKSGACGVYPVRPITCRIYMSFSDPARCEPKRINEGEVVTYILDFLEDANILLDKLDLKYRQGLKNSSLRAGLIEVLG